MRKLLICFYLILLNLIIGCNSKEEHQTNIINDKQDISSKDSLVATLLDSVKIPKSAKYQGNFKKAIRWNDELGESVVILTETGIHRNNKFKHEFDDSADFELMAYHFNLNKEEPQQVWKMYDFVTDCPVDIEAGFDNQFPIITDLNKNGIAEVWIMYKVGCHGDVSPVTLKLIMYEGNKKYALRGENKVQVGVKEYLGGKYQFDKAFNSAPIAFRNYAIKLWNENVYKN